MTIEGLPDPYCDITYADGINTSSAWIAASTTEKENALQWGRVYFDSKYSCDYWEDPPSNVMTANAILGEEYLIDSSKFFSQEKSAPTLKRKSVKAGDVETAETFQDSSEVIAIDNFPSITALVGDVCNIPSGTFGTASVLRR